MSLRRRIVDFAIGFVCRRPKIGRIPETATSIFVLRNNDLGDVLTTTPLFEALRMRYPSARITAGVGEWSKPILENNPFVDAVITMNAPWHNKAVAKHPANSLAGVREALRFIRGSPEVERLRQESPAIGIDVLGSPQGALLLNRSGAGFRLGAAGYAGGTAGYDAWVEYSPVKPVAAMALEFATLLKPGAVPEARPQIFLSDAERRRSADWWASAGGTDRLKIVVQPGAGLPEKAWPKGDYARLVEQLQSLPHEPVTALIGSAGDRSLVEAIKGNHPGVHCLAGLLSLRESFAIIAGADLVICNSSMSMHVAAAFKKPCLVLLGESYADAGSHCRQWGYAETVCLGRGPARSRLATPQEAFAEACALMQPR